MQTTSQHLSEDIILCAQSLLDDQWGLLTSSQRESVTFILESAQDFLSVWKEFSIDGIYPPKLASLLRDPLTVILGYASLLSDGLEGELTNSQQDFADRIYRNTAVLHNELDMLYYAGIIA